MDKVIPLNPSDQFTDKVFAANKSSLIERGQTSVSNIPWNEIEWIRANEITELNDEEGALSVFAGGIQPNDIKQGLLGDCYYLSVLAALAETPDRITNLFNLKRTTV